jgi:hypothetical protein
MIEMGITVLSVFVVGELFALLIFKGLNTIFSGLSAKKDVLSMWKGLLERGVVLIGLVIGFPQILILFGALKIGTRLKNDHPVSNDYYFIGNMISILLVLTYYMCVKAVVILFPFTILPA